MSISVSFCAIVHSTVEIWGREALVINIYTLASLRLLYDIVSTLSLPCIHLYSTSCNPAHPC